MKAEHRRAFDEAGHFQPPGRGVDRWCLEVVADVEVRVGHDDAADEGGDGGFAVERVSLVRDHSLLQCLLPRVAGTGGLRGPGDDRQAGCGPGAHAPGQVDDVVAMGAKRAGDGGGAAAEAAHHNDALCFGQLVAACLDFAHRDQNRLGRVPLRHSMGSRTSSRTAPSSSRDFAARALTCAILAAAMRPDP